ncbi:MAG: glycosyltransferase family 4 protein [Pseudochelatococcus sp.]|jgi:glycosyltransferase involved in cell wall biosynthesis|uniref:glycosyltransferase family 4 protein n=1 Tax=Pseudochelatococcus sp. TaxID=2020869 RepID=UPI003D8FD77F
MSTDVTGNRSSLIDVCSNEGVGRKIKVAIVVSHPIQHFVHFYRALAARNELSIKVFFCSRIGVDEYFDKNMGVVIRWAGDMTGGFDHEFLPEASGIKNTRFRSINNPSIGAALRAFEPDVVMIYGFAQATPLRALAWCRVNGIPVLMTTDSNFVTKRPFHKRLLRQTMLRLLLSQVSGFLTVGDQNEDALEELGVPRTKMYRTPFTIDEQRYRRARAERAELRVQIRERYGIAREAFLGIAVGKLIPRKRTQDAVMAFAEVAKTDGDVNAHLLVCGNGPDAEQIEAHVKTGAPVTMAGFVNIDELPNHFAAADVLVHPSGQDPHPLICSEAACIGLPMILSDRVGTIGPTDISRRDENALVYPCGDVKILADRIFDLAVDRHALEEMSAASLRIYEECSLAVSVDGFLRAVNGVASKVACQ